VQLNAEPFCRLCANLGLVVPATTVDHIVPHDGNLTAFRRGKLQSLCEACHNGWKQREERDGYQPDIGIDGWPLDPRHPAYQPNDPFGLRKPKPMRLGARNPRDRRRGRYRSG
jgi:5-methylcytosine-specific restriction protein A